MTPLEDHLDVLQNIEAAVVSVWHEHRDITNYTVLRAYETAIAHYHALARDFEPKPANLKGLDAKVFEAVQGVCEWRLGHTQDDQKDEVTPISLEDLVACLRKLKKSVDLWTKQGGRQGYLDFIAKFVG